MAMEINDDDRMRLMLMILTKMFQNEGLPEELSSSVQQPIEVPQHVAPIVPTPAPVSRFSALKAKMAEHEESANGTE
jgi:hypothetical protein